MTPRRLVIPDIHGCARTFRHLVEEVVRFEPGDTLYLLGDLIDRGPRSKEVLDTVLRLQAAGLAVVPLRGNHEQMLLDAGRDLDDFRLWMINGGGVTLANFGVKDTCDIPLEYREFLASLPYYVELEEFILVHAGLNFLIPDPLRDRAAMLWARQYVVDRELIGGRRLICGHTPQSRTAIRQSLTTDLILLDNGCVYRHHPELGCLTALDLDSMALSFQENIDLP